MSLDELKEQAAVLPPDEQAELAAFVAERLRRDDPLIEGNWRASLMIASRSIGGVGAT